MRKIFVVSIIFLMFIIFAQPQSNPTQPQKSIWKEISEFPENLVFGFWADIRNGIKFVYLPYHKSVMCTLCEKGVEEYVATTLIALTASSMLIAIMYMMGQALEHGQIQAWSRVELGELFMSIFFFAVFTGMLDIMCTMKVTTFFPSLAQPNLNHDYGNMNVFEASNALLYEFAVSGEALMLVQFILGKFLTWTCSMILHGAPVGMGTHGQVLQGLLSIVNAIMQMTMITTGISIITALGQMHVLNFAQVLFIKYLLPIAFVARCFSPTRRFGGAIIAIAATFIFIYPFLVVMFYQTYEVNKMPFTTMLKTWMGYFGGKNWFKKWEEISTSNNPAIILGFGLLSAFVSLLTITFIPPTATIFIGGILVPLLLTIVVITGVRHLSRLIGEEVDITNLTRMI